MNHRIFLAMGATLGVLVASRILVAADPAPEETGRAVCRLKPVEKEVKKTVYSSKCVPYCQSRCSCWFPCFCHDFCLRCDKPRYRRVLLKCEKVEKHCEMQCVLEYDPYCGLERPASDKAPPAPAPESAPAKPRGGYTAMHPPDQYE